MNPISTLTALSLAGVFAATAALSEPTHETPRSDTDFESNFVAPDVDPVTKNPAHSNWPGLPERHAGRPYSKLVVTTFGPRERNFESGRN